MKQLRNGRAWQLSALAAAISAVSAPAAAAEFVVTSKAPTGEGSLNAAIGNANESAGTDTIRFEVGGTINLDGYALPEITGGLTIDGPGRGGLTIDPGTSESTVFRVNLNSGNNVYIEGLTVRNSLSGAVRAINGYEGRLFLDDVVITNAGSDETPVNTNMVRVQSGADVVMTNSEVRNIVANNSSAIFVTGEGASLSFVNGRISNVSADGVSPAIEVFDDANLEIIDSTVTGSVNAGEGPGAVGVKYGAFAYIENSEFTNNHAEYLENGRGGAIRVLSADADIFNSEFRNNSAAAAGGAISAEDSEVFVKYSTLTGNKVSLDEGKYSGGAIAARDSLLVLSGSVVTGNRAPFGGGVSADSALAVIKYSQISNNKANAGAGIGADEAEVDVKYSAITGNTGGFGSSFSVGGGIFAEDDTDVDVRFSVIRNNSATYGGALFSGFSDIDIEDSQITGNSAEFGGGIVAYEAYDFDFQDSVLANNTASGPFGGMLVAMYEDEGTINIDDSALSGNRSGDGPAILLDIEYYNGLNIWASTISGNVGVDAPAVLIRGEEYTDMYIENSTFSGNKANGHRAAIVIADVEDGEIRNSTFVDNKGAGSDTAQLHLPGSYDTDDTPDIVIQNSAFTSSNTAEVIVGGLELDNDGSYGDDPDIDLEVVANIMTAGLMQVGESANISNTFGAVPADPGLGPLTNNGGSTETHAPLSADSAVVNQGVGSRPEGIDQRGADTVAMPDIGSVEYTDNTPPRLVSNLTGSLSGVVGKEVSPIVVLDYFVDDEGDNIFVEDVSGLPLGLTYDEACEGAICGTLEAAGEYPVSVTVIDDGDPSLSRTVSAVVKVRSSAAPVFIIDDDDDGGSLPLTALALAGAMSWLRRRRR